MKHDLILVTLTPDQIAKAKEANGIRKRITHALICGPYGQMFRTEKQCLKYWKAWDPCWKIELPDGKYRAIFPDLFRRALKTSNHPIANFETTFNLVNILIEKQDSIEKERG